MFNEKTHAFIAASYFKYLKEIDRIDIFIKATQYYGYQRGHRMALRALRNHDALNYENYFKYSEWTPSKDMKALGQHNQSVVLSSSPDVVRKINVCPWYTKFKEMNALECGKVYCKYIDRSIAEGFYPELVYLVETTLNESDHCLHVQKDVNCNIESIRQYKEGIKGFDYHCAHLYYAFKEIIECALNDSSIAINVLDDYADVYGSRSKKIIESFKETNFNII